MTRRSWTFRTAATTVAFAAAAATFSAAGVAQADSPSRPEAVDRHDPSPDKTTRSHDLKGPLSDTQAAQREEALKQVISGNASVKKKDGSNVVQLKSKKGDAKYVELGREKTDKIFTILVEFGDKVDSRYGGDAGPLHNEIAKPNRRTDNSTAWQEDYDQEHFQDLYFGSGKGVNSVKTYYEKQSSGRYSVDGEVSDWVKVPYNEARYGSNKCDPDNCAWYAVQDGVTAWIADQKAAGRTDAQIKSQLTQYDQWDRYDFDGDGDFNEPDGYIDHFQIVHAGEDESAGGGAQGEDAIWAHRWYAFGTDAGATGPADNKLGGTQIGDTGIWVGDYTIQPENGGLGVYAHEYGHDLGLPDHYDTAGGDNSTGFWTLMSSGSWLGTGRNEIGDLPGDMNAWDKLQLGWLNYDTAKAGVNSWHKLGLAEYNTKHKQGLVVELPKEKVTTEIVTPAEGETQWWSGSGNDLKNTLSRSVDLTGKSAASLTLDGWYDIEADYDFLYTEVSTDGGANWTAIDGTFDGNPIQRDGSDKPALSATVDAYGKLVYPLDAYAGKKIDLRFRYQTDGGLAMKGFTADEIAVTADGETLFSDNAETADDAWTAVGFTRKGASFTKEYAQYYIAENRQYVSYDKTLKTGPYNFGFSERPNWVEHYAYQNGLLIWKWDTSQADNNTSQHPGKGLVLPIDSHPTALKWKDGTVMRNRMQAYDSPFSLYRTDGMTLHKADVAKYVPGSKGVSVFNDRKNDYYDPANPTGGVKITDTNTKIKILKEAKNGSTIELEVGPAGR
ncbi:MULTISPECIES: immune inhibitor A domain-containing protein [Streptomyces]|uniref:Secreted protease n=1 Tax=Streptomyces coelicolor (strain ATCC BAA-471 / A3(2) / M145) TaxID=100226 RepID=Q9S2G1_STRCO|nr:MULTISPECIES: immune inhibitor A domain-containing protein [Streptomyces]MYU42446.1 M6 family metalloprotease domain-containing protein [Streptomyces sp. SID7813]MDX2925747.1 immune inhibitor A [Streptomyces sp. NRRL_B-16638]MDX3411300.1 immune inhibitor A [Streptomyces sp. ME02-6977A]NSL82471.1 M6 family metalloprotease domain-containing protein [Streptomyces coelicolor]QFI43014.1 M6 family metalloprotease domain-containing protein [Streptomyces coelicolor A3(2)]